MGQIILEHQTFSFNEILAGKWQVEVPYFKECLIFCQDWLSGKQEFVLKTSGSTGNPKDILVTRSQMEKSAKATAEFFKIPTQPLLLGCINTAMIGGKMMLVRAMEWDASIYLCLPSSNPFKEEWMQQPYDFVAMVPMQVESSLRNQEQTQFLRKIKTLIIGGATSSPKLVEEIKKARLNAFQTYGMTETVSHIALAKIESGDLIYSVLPEVNIGVDDQSCLWIEAPMAQEKRLQTNDIVELVSPTSFKWLGRADFIINSGGVKIHPEIIEKQIEKIITASLGPVNYFIIGETDDYLGQRAVLIIESELDQKKEQELLKLLKSNLNKYECPKRIYGIPSFQRTDSGKTNRIQTLKLCGSN
ncbi:O-succinylbenzoic acid--CoA ligase [Belliella buryatensis]|uniref:O-succinylbenzoic acid--CoA ligase n=1 Tax=Belliella buryatensis TaxID=1500549 RepID=A0A239CF54_9BACT|nr:AMP-binding protein [Belliella buryatensis]SNS18866.1 O-succinylbenzoic acid--CoA ligase [Belliella buryatensis]